MENVNAIFEQATRDKVRISSNIGMLSAEELWDLPVEEDLRKTRREPETLNNLYKILNKELKESEEASLVATKTRKTEVLELKIALVKHIAEVKMEEEKKKKEELEKKNKKAKLVEVLERKKDAQLENLSPEEIEKMINEL